MLSGWIRFRFFSKIYFRTPFLSSWNLWRGWVYSDSESENVWENNGEISHPKITDDFPRLERISIQGAILISSWFKIVPKRRESMCILFLHFGQRAEIFWFFQFFNRFLLNWLKVKINNFSLKKLRFIAMIQP